MVAAMIINSEMARIRAALVNTGLFSFPEADAKLAASTLLIVAGADDADTPAGQAAFLTAVATGARCFGAVYVAGAVDAPLAVPLAICARTLGEAAIAMGGQPADGRVAPRQISIGGGAPSICAWEVRAYWSGWIAGATPASQRREIGRGDCALAGVAAGAVAVGQAFLAEQGDPRAGRTNQCLSLWSPHTLPADGENPDLSDISLPRALWLIGLGNLGQAYLWSLFLLPYADPASVLLFLQDDDTIDSENWGTSVLVERGRYGVLKTKIAEEWAARRRFDARRVDRRFDETLRRGAREPGIALAGLDRMPPRRLLGIPGFEYVIDSGLGATAASYQDFRINIFDRTHNPAKHFDGVEDRTAETAKALLGLPAYRDLSKSLNDGGCGAATLAEKSVAVPFVSALVSALVVTAAVRIASGEPPHRTITGASGDLSTVRATLGERPERIVVETAAARPYTTLGQAVLFPVAPPECESKTPERLAALDQR
jgi:hypothetical protein